METKEAILATIDELNSDSGFDSRDNSSDLKDSRDSCDLKDSRESRQNLVIDIKEEVENDESLSDEARLLLNLKERSLVLFSGLRSLDKNEASEQKFNMVISYLEYQLAMIEDRLGELEKESK